MSSNLRTFSLTSDSSKENSMGNSILNNIQTENTWIDVETLAKLKGVTKRAVRISINKYEYRTENTRGGKSYKIKGKPPELPNWALPKRKTRSRSNST